MKQEVSRLSSVTAWLIPRKVIRDLEEKDRGPTILRTNIYTRIRIVCSRCDCTAGLKQDKQRDSVVNGKQHMIMIRLTEIFTSKAT